MPPSAFDTAFNADTVAIATSRAIHRYGLRPPTFKQIGESINASISSVHGWFGGKAAMMPQAAWPYVGLVEGDLHAAVAPRGWAGLIPVDDAELARVRVVLAREELGRVRDDLAAPIAHLWDVIADLIRQHGVEPPGYELAVVTLRGLSAALCAPYAPMERGRAAEIWASLAPGGGRSAE